MPVGNNYWDPDDPHTARYVFGAMFVALLVGTILDKLI